jgi:hypothetical protein
MRRLCGYPPYRFGWDCHGLPVEYEIDQKLGIVSPDQVIKMGIETYNGHCRSIVSRYCEQWEEIVTRLGRWIDFKNDYKVGGFAGNAATHDCDGISTSLWLAGNCLRGVFVDHGALVHGVRVVGFQDHLRERFGVPWLQGISRAPLES